MSLQIESAWRWSLVGLVEVFRGFWVQEVVHWLVLRDAGCLGNVGDWADSTAIVEISSIALANRWPISSSRWSINIRCLCPIWTLHSILLRCQSLIYVLRFTSIAAHWYCLHTFFYLYYLRFNLIFEVIYNLFLILQFLF